MVQSKHPQTGYPPPTGLSRRHHLARFGAGFGLLGLTSVLTDDGMLNAAEPAVGNGSDLSPLAPKQPHFAPTAKHVVHFFLKGGPSQIDTFDPKPMLNRQHGKSAGDLGLPTERKTGMVMRSPFSFRRRGQSGIPVSELFEKTGDLIDDICVVRSMHCDVPNHEPSILLLTCGHNVVTRPSWGAWATYGLGSENQNMPGYFALCPDGLPTFGARLWGSSFLPGAYQGTFLETKHRDIDRLIENVRNTSFSHLRQRRQLNLVRQLNELHRDSRHDDLRLEARIQSFELASRMQLDASDVLDVNQEPQHIQELYGSGPHARQMIITRRMIERGVRFVQVFTHAGGGWDSHENLEDAHRRLARDADQPLCAFLTDLKQRGLLDSTLVVVGGEFGRTPVAELPKLSGRDHNHYGFSFLLAGGGIKGGCIHGATDDLGFAAVENKVHYHDLHATILHCLGLDHEKLTYRFAGRDFRLTDVHGNVVHDVLA
jgi:hypothetical protein